MLREYIRKSTEHNLNEIQLSFKGFTSSAKIFRHTPNQIMVKKVREKLTLIFITI